MSYDYERRPGFVYFVQETELRRIKIGFTSSHPVKHLSTLSNASSQALVIIGFEVGDKALEAKLHKKFKHLHRRSGWFEPGDDLLQYIDRLDYGTPFEKALQQFVRAPRGILLPNPAPLLKRVEPLPNPSLNTDAPQSGAPVS